jgi:8-oxo-dGTP diphosphatase
MWGDGDGWVVCEQGHRHWGRHGAAGLLVRRRGDGGDRVVLQHRADWSHQGGTWGVPGGARDSDESPLRAALREAAEEAGIEPDQVRPQGLLYDDHGGWSYTTVVAEPAGPLHPRPTGGESADVRWVEVGEVDRLPLHPGFAASWPRPTWCWSWTARTWSAPAAAATAGGATGPVPPAGCGTRWRR